MTTTADRRIDTGTDELRCEVRDRVAIVTLNRPQARNSLSDQLRAAQAHPGGTAGAGPAS